MASPQVGSVTTKLSFAKVAAMQPPSISSAIGIPKTEDTKNRAPAPLNGRKMSQNHKVHSPMLPTKIEPTRSEKNIQEADADRILGGIEGLSLVKDSLKVVNGATGAESGESMEDDQSHLSNSSLKQQSFDTKSMASVTTFAMDEKESLRPDDSASVRAADEDEISNEVGRHSTFQQDVEVKVPSLKGPTRKESKSVTIPHRRYHTLTLSNPPRFGDLPIEPVLDLEATDHIPPPRLSEDVHEDQHVRMAGQQISPDEKILEALANPKERLPLLQLEEKILTFILHSRDDYLDLPPQNSFARLLAHKLSDYYNLAHHINDDGSSIRIFRTPGIVLPTPLTTIARSILVGPTQPTGSTAMTIMRRAGLGPLQPSTGGSTAASSSAPSKTTSEAGVETNSDEGMMSPPEGTPSRDKSKLTREEREAQYKAVRDRIFGDFQESMASEGASTGENSATMSRSSSSSGKRKNRRQKTPKDDSFEARSAFMPSFASAHSASMQPQFHAQYIDQGYQASYGGNSTGYSPNANYGTTPTQSYSGFDQGMMFNNAAQYGGTGHNLTPESWQTMQSPSSNGYFNYHQGTGVYQQNVASVMPQMNNHFMANSGQVMTQSQNWINNQFQNQYPQHTSHTNPSLNNWPGYGQPHNMTTAPNYQYGQLPPQNFTNNTVYNQQHPIPGSYTRSLFNPQTRSFVPSNSSTRSGYRNGRKKSLQATTPSRNGTPLRTPGSDNLDNNSLPFSRGLDVGGANSSARAKEDSLQQKYGAPAHLPKKPPPSQVPSTYDVESINHLTSVSAPLVINGGGNGVSNSSS